MSRTPTCSSRRASTGNPTMTRSKWHKDIPKPTRVPKPAPANSCYLIEAVVFPSLLDETLAVGPSHRLKGGLVFPNDRLTCQVARAQGSCPLLQNQTFPAQTNSSVTQYTLSNHSASAGCRKFADPLLTLAVALSAKVRNGNSNVN